MVLSLILKMHFSTGEISMIHSFKDYNEAVNRLKRIQPDSQSEDNNNYVDTIFLDNNNNVPMFHFTELKKYDWLKQSLSTRLGGVSSGIYETMNLSFNLSDSHENVLNNFKIIADSIGIPVENMVYSKQTHTTNVLKIDDHHKGMGIIKDRDYDNIDGLITNVPGICLVTSFADCIPVIIIDPVKKVIASLHSGWRGTVGNISKNAIDIMQADYGCKSEHLLGFIGPGICSNCYEISLDVADKFTNAYSDRQIPLILKPGKSSDKFYLDLLMANRVNLINCGIKPSNIYTADVCTCCNPKLLPSHRATGGKRGLMCNFIYIKGVN